MLMPTDKKNNPINRPVKGSIISATRCRNSVSANSRPARSAPIAIESPIAQVAAAMPSVASKTNAKKVSALPSAFK